MADEQLKRDYQGGDDFMTESARTTYTLLVDDLPDFGAINQMFGEDFLNSFLADVVAAESVVSDCQCLKTVDWYLPHKRRVCDQDT